MEQAILATLGSTFAVLVTLILYLDRSHRTALESHRQETRAEFEAHRQALVALEVQGAETRASLEALRAETRNGFQRIAELTQAVLDLAHRVGRLEGRLDKTEEAAEPL